MKIFLILCVFLTLTGCSDEITETSVSNKTIELDNKHALHIEKRNFHEQTVGVFTKSVYSQTNSFRYYLTLKPEAAQWEGRGSEPKNILLCQDTIYLHLMENRLNPLYLEAQRKQVGEDADKDLTAGIPSALLGNYYSKFVDKRYFFNLFGDAYWVDIPAQTYQSATGNCVEHKVPNDNEFVLEATQLN